MTSFAAVMVCVLLGALAVFQALLSAGRPWGRFAWGGQHRVLPTRLRVGSALSIVVYALLGLIVLDRADLVATGASDSVVRVATWGVAGYFLLGIAVNLASRSRPERMVMSPLVAVLFALTVVVAAA